MIGTFFIYEGCTKKPTKLRYPELQVMIELEKLLLRLFQTIIDTYILWKVPNQFSSFGDILKSKLYKHNVEKLKNTEHKAGQTYEMSLNGLG